MLRFTIVVALAAAAAACARPMAPPGGERDVAPPALVSTDPAPLAIVPPGDDPVRFRFDERVSERGFTEALVTVSPLDSAIRVERSGAEVRVRLDGGWRANRVYRVVLLPGLRDLFGNERRDQVELVFSTGGPIVNTALAGVVLNRVTGAPAQRGLVEAVDDVRGARYTAVADSSGFFALRYLPPGEYAVHAFDDQNRNRRRDAQEPLDSARSAVLRADGDTVTLVFDVLSPDSTAPEVGDAELADSLHVRVELDDFVDPAVLATVNAAVFALPDSVPAAIGLRVMSAAGYVAEQARADTSAPADSARAMLPRRPPAPSAAALRLPTREIVVALDRPLRSGTYVIVLSGVTNLNGLTGGGAERFDVEAPPPPPPPPPSPPPDAGGQLPER